MENRVQAAQESPSESTARRLSEGVAWLKDRISEWRRDGVFGEIGITFNFENGNIRFVKRNVEQVKK